VHVCAGRSLHGKDAQRFAELAQRVASEQQLFLKAMWAGVHDSSQRYAYMDPRVDAQLQVGRLGCKRFL
jgi:truncated hemoglobin YjbI